MLTEKALIHEVKTLFNFYPFELIDIIVSVFHIFVFVFDNDDGDNEKRSTCLNSLMSTKPSLSLSKILKASLRSDSISSEPYLITKLTLMMMV